MADTTPKATTVLAEKVNEAHADFHNQKEAFLAAMVFLLEMEVRSKRDLAVQRSLQEFEAAAGRLNMDARSYFRAGLFANLISAIEEFLQEVVIAVIEAHPGKIGRSSFTIAELISAGSNEALISRAAAQNLTAIMYERPKKYLQEICRLLAIEVTTLRPVWSAYVEAKARRDTGVHNNWQCDENYLRKTKEVGVESEFKFGESTVPVDSDYLKRVTEVLQTMADIIRDETLKKHCE